MIDFSRERYERPEHFSNASPAEPEMVMIVMDEPDWNFVIDCLRFRARNGSGADTIERATFTADSIKDVLDGAR